MDMDTVMMDYSDGDTGNFDEEEPEIKFHHDMISKPIVYTTKLDEMKVFRDDTTDMSIDHIIDSIIKESKPKLNWQRKCTHTINSHYSYEDLSCHINTFNRKVARIGKHNKNMLSMCKPVKVVLEDIKYTLLRTQRSDNKISKIVKKKNPIVSDNPFPTYIQSRKLHSRIIYDQQHKEADIYALDKSYFIKEYTKFRIDDSNSKIFYLPKLDKNVSHVSSCCCWYKREKTLAMLPLAPHETLRFMRKPHKCAFNLCRCCCRNQTMTSYSVRPTSLEPLESHSVWLNRMIEVHKSLPLSDKSKKTLLSKSMSNPTLKKKNSSVNPMVETPVTTFLHSTNIDFGGEYYSIGADGQIKLYLKGTGNYRRKLLNLRLKTANNIMGNICCWYKREEFAGRLLALGALSNTVNYIRRAHPCSPTNCSCCCKPSNTRKPELTVLYKSARHTNDLVAKSLNIKVRFSREPEKPVIPRNLNDFVSFNVSLSALEALSKNRTEPYDEDVLDSLIPESATLDKKNSSVRVFVEKAHKHKIVIECTQLNNFTTKELRMLDIIFCAANKAIIPKEENKSKRTRVWKHHLTCFYHTIYPLLLNTQLSVATDLRSKRFMPSLRAHLDKTHISPLPQMKKVSAWLDNEESLESTSTISVEFKDNTSEKKIQRIVHTNKRKRGQCQVEQQEQNVIRDRNKIDRQNVVDYGSQVVEIPKSTFGIQNI